MGAIKDTIDYEASEFIKSFRKLKLWQYFTLILSLFLFLKGQNVLGVIFLIITIILLGSEDYKSGLVIAYKRRKMGIPSKSQIKEIKYERN